MTVSVRSSPAVVFSEQNAYVNYVKAAHSSKVQYSEETMPEEMITHLLFEEVGGSELILLSRHDTIDGIDIDYSLIGNLSAINTMFNSNNIITGFETRDTYFNQHQMEAGPELSSVFFNDNGDLEIEMGDLTEGQSIEVVFLTDGIMYTNEDFE